AEVAVSDREAGVQVAVRAQTWGDEAVLVNGEVCHGPWIADRWGIRQRVSRPGPPCSELGGQTHLANGQDHLSGVIQEHAVGGREQRVQLGLRGLRVVKKGGCGQLPVLSSVWLSVRLRR